MSDLFRRAAEMRAADAEAAARMQQYDETLESRKQRLVEESRARAQEFVGLMASKQVVALPVYARLYRKVPGIPTYTSVPQKALRVGEGWLLRKGSYDYETGSIDTLVVTREADIYPCEDEIKTSFPSPAFRASEPEFFEVTGLWHEGEKNCDPTNHTVLAGDGGFDLVARALILNRVA